MGIEDTVEKEETMLDNECTRRNFVAGSAAMTAGIVAAGTVSASANADETSSSRDWMPETWDYETDVLVIGYGGAGMWTALTAVDECGSEVLILEKAPFLGGGNSSYNFGEFQCPVDEDLATQYIVNSTRGLTPEPLARAWVKEAMRNIEYADHWNYPWYQTEDFTSTSGTTCEYAFLPGGEGMACCRCEGLGVAAFNVLDQARADLGIEVVFDCHDEELIQNPDTKEILGCWTYIGDDQAPKAVKARKGTVICTGGFEFNEELKNNWLKCNPAKFYGWIYNTGDGIDMVTKVGAQLWHMDLFSGGAWGAPANNDPEFPWNIPFLSVPTSNYIHVNQQGKRWHNEGTASNPHNGWHEYLPFNEKICDFDHIPSWTIFDQTGFEAGRMGPRSTDALAHANYMAGFPQELGGWGDEFWSEDNRAELEKGWILTGETIADLAHEIAKYDVWMDAATLEETVNTYNSYCEAGEDPDFGRPASILLPVATPPFYAFPVYPGGCSTYGGAKRNENAQVLDWEDQPIPRLYSAGSFGNFLGHTYGITGGNVAENMVFGRLAARHASSLDGWDA